jgi:hypothetical protein
MAEIRPISKHKEPLAPEQQRRESFMSDLNGAIRVEWRHEIINRYASTAIALLSFSARLMLAVLAGVQVKLATEGEVYVWLAVATAALSVLNLALPKLSDDSKFHRRQRVHDQRARAFMAIRTELKAETVRFDEAVTQFVGLLRESPEADVESTEAAVRRRRR